MTTPAIARVAADLRAIADPTNANGRDPADRQPLEVMTAREICELADPPQSDELLGALVLRGQRVVLGGQTGEGKTTFCFSLVRAIVESGEMLGYRGAGGRALILDAEQGVKTIKRRARENGLAESDAVDIVRAPDGLELDSDSHDIAEVERIIAAGNYSIVVLDPLYKLHRGDSNDERSAVDLMRRLDGWRERYGFALILPVHCRKPQPMSGKFTLHDFFGSGGYTRGAEVVLGIQRMRPGYSRLHYFKDRDGDLPIGEAWGLLFDRDAGYRRDPDDEKPKQTAAERIRELLTETPGLTLKQLVAETEYAERTVSKALKEIGADYTRPGSQGEMLWNLDGEGAK